MSGVFFLFTTKTTQSGEEIRLSTRDTILGTFSFICILTFGLVFYFRLISKIKYDE